MRHIAATVLLGPLLFVQGRWVRARVPKLPEAEGPRTGTTGSGESLRLLILGDSAAAGVGARHQDEALLGQATRGLANDRAVTYRLHAETGATTLSTLESLDTLAGETFDVAVTSLGVNDVTGMVSTTRWLQQQRELRQRLREQHGVQRLLISSLPPMGDFPALPQPLRWYLGRRADDFTALLRQDLQSEPHCEFLEMAFDRAPEMMASDGFHPGPPAYTAWGQKVAEVMLAMTEQAGDSAGATIAAPE